MKNIHVNVNNNETLMFSQKYLILTEKLITQNELKDFKILRFIANNKKWDCL